MILHRQPTLHWLGICDSTDNLQYSGWESMILQRLPTLHWLGINDPTETTYITLVGNQ